MKNDDILLDAEELATLPSPLINIEAVLANRIKRVAAEARRRGRAVEELHALRADDLCWKDLEKLYEEFGLPAPDNSVGSRREMLKNCERYIRCMTAEGDRWPSYKELAETLRAVLRRLGPFHDPRVHSSEEETEQCEVCRANTLSQQVTANYGRECPPEEQNPAEISPSWTDRERLRVIYGEAVLLARARVSRAEVYDIQGGVQRIAYLAAHAPEFLEANRENFRGALQYLKEHKQEIRK